MAIIYTYPVKGTPLAADLVLISDTADGNKSKNATIASLVTSNAIDVVDTLNSLKGDVSITGGANITVTPSGQNIEISTSASNVDGSGTANTIPKWSDSNTLTDSPFTIDTSINSLDIPTFIRHIGDTDSKFGFQGVDHFRVDTGGQTTIQSISRTDELGNTGQVAGLYFNSSQRLFTRGGGVEVEGSIFMPGYIKHLGDSDSFFGFSGDNNFILHTDSGVKIAAGPTGVTLYSDTSATDAQTSLARLATTVDGVIVYGQGVSDVPAKGGTVRFYNSSNNAYVGIKGPLNGSGTMTTYEVVLPANVGSAGQALKLPSTIGTSPYQLAWGDAGGGTGGFETLPFTTANGYLAGEASLGTYVFQMIAPSNCEAENFKFYNLLAQSAGRTTTVAIYKGVIGDETAPGELHSAGGIGGVLGAAQISGSTLTVVDGATAISAGDNIVVCFSIDQDIQPLGVIPITVSDPGVALANASPVNNSKLAIQDSTVSLTAAQIQANYTTVTALEAVLTNSAATTSRPFLLIY
jgi:hypothetical protein